MQRVALREALLRRTGTVPNAGARYGPGSAAHRFARATRCAASGEHGFVNASEKKFHIPYPRPPNLAYPARVLSGEEPLSRGDPSADGARAGRTGAPRNGR